MNNIIFKNKGQQDTTDTSYIQYSTCERDTEISPRSTCRLVCICFAKSNFKCYDYDGLPRGYLFPCFPEINLLVPMPPKKFSCVSCSPILSSIPCFSQTVHFCCLHYDVASQLSNFKNRESDFIKPTGMQYINALTWNWNDKVLLS